MFAEGDRNLHRHGSVHRRRETASGTLRDLKTSNNRKSVLNAWQTYVWYIQMFAMCGIEPQQPLASAVTVALTPRQNKSHILNLKTILWTKLPSLF